MNSVIGVIILILDIFAIVKIAQSGASVLEKILWILGVLLFPVLGLIIWYFVGPGGKRLPA